MDQTSGDPSLRELCEDEGAATPETGDPLCTLDDHLLTDGCGVRRQGSDVTGAQPTIAEEVERYLLTGESDPLYSAWSGSFMERATRAQEDLRGALVRAVRGLTEGLTHEPRPDAGTIALARRKVEPMVRGLFPRAEQDAVLGTLEQSVALLTSANIERPCRKAS